MFRLARSNQPAARSSRQRHIADAILHLLHVIDQSGEQGCLRRNAQSCHSCPHGDLHHLDRMRTAQTTAWRGPPFGSLVTRPIRAGCQYHCSNLHKLVGKIIALLRRNDISSQPADAICSSSGPSGPLSTTSIARHSTGHARCSSSFWGARF